MRYFRNNIFIYITNSLLILYACQAKKSTYISDDKNQVQNINNPKKEVFISPLILNQYLHNASTVIPNRKIGSPFDTLSYDKVIAYDFDGRHENNSVITQQGSFVLKISKQQFLTQEQTDFILKSLTNKSSYGGKVFACFEPHFALVFYKANKMVTQINVCLDCNYLTSTIEIPAQSSYSDSSEIELIGFSKNGKNEIISLCRELNFSYGILSFK